MDSLDLAGAVVIVTGASSGIGAATARLLYDAGAHPVLAARRADRLAVLSADLGGALAITADVTGRGDIRRIAEAALERHGQINALVNNAGASLHLPLDRLDPDDFARTLDLNVVSVLAMTQTVLPAMRAGLGKHRERQLGDHPAGAAGGGRLCRQQGRRERAYRGHAQGTGR